MAAVIDWICEGRGLMCRDCAAEHVSDPTTPHRDHRHECCLVCGFRSETTLNALDVSVTQGAGHDHVGLAWTC
jgi:hypothetical protein